MEETNKPINPLPKEQLKERMNFAKMFERQGKQIKQTAHITNLLNPKTEIKQEQGPDLKSRIEKLEDHYNMHTIEQRFDLLEEKLAGKIEEINTPKKIKFKFEIKNKRHAYFIAATGAIAAIIIGLVARPASEVKVEEKVVYKEAPVKKVQKYFMTKFVNIRSHASTSAKKLTTLSPNSVVEILEVQRGWKKIKYVDHINKRTLIGWAYGENLKLVK